MVVKGQMKGTNHDSTICTKSKLSGFNERKREQVWSLEAHSNLCKINFIKNSNFRLQAIAYQSIADEQLFHHHCKIVANSKLGSKEILLFIHFL